MYKLVIVEDESDVRNRIVNLIGKAGAAFEIIAQYETGIDAYEGIINDAPDLILTDIKIPYINGIELAKKVRSVLPLVKVVIITGYNEFDYAKEAANLGVVGFISKPVTLEDIREALGKAQSALDSEYLSAVSLNRLSEFYEGNLPVIRENDLYRLSNMTDINPAFMQKLRNSGVELDYACFVMCVFDFDETWDATEERYGLALSSMRQTVGEDLKGMWEFELFNRYDKLCLLIKSNEAPDMGEFENRLERIIQRIGRHSGMPVSVGVSGVHEKPGNFAAMLREAMRALGYRGVMGGGRVFVHGGGRLSPRPLMDDRAIKELGYILHFKPRVEALNRIDEIWRGLAGVRESLYYVATNILNVLIKGCDDLEGLYSRYGGPDGLYRKLFDLKTDEEIKEYLSELASAVRELNDGVIVDSVELSLRKVTIYMENHYCDPDMSFESLAAAVGLSVSYISALLKKKLNTSFVKLQMGLRMEKAKELLADPNLKIIDVAEMLGYNDSYYFSHCFKKYMGVSPKEFRSEPRLS